MVKYCVCDNSAWALFYCLKMKFWCAIVMKMCFFLLVSAIQDTRYIESNFLCGIIWVCVCADLWKNHYTFHSGQLNHMKKPKKMCILKNGTKMAQKCTRKQSYSVDSYYKLKQRHADAQTPKATRALKLSNCFDVTWIKLVKMHDSSTKVKWLLGYYLFLFIFLISRLRSRFLADGCFTKYSIIILVWIKC